MLTYKIKYYFMQNGGAEASSELLHKPTVLVFCHGKITNVKKISEDKYTYIGDVTGNLPTIPPQINSYLTDLKIDLKSIYTIDSNKDTCPDFIGKFSTDNPLFLIEKNKLTDIKKIIFLNCDNNIFPQFNYELVYNTFNLMFNKLRNLEEIIITNSSFLDETKPFEFMKYIERKNKGKIIQLKIEKEFKLKQIKITHDSFPGHFLRGPYNGHTFIIERLPTIKIKLKRLIKSITKMIKESIFDKKKIILDGQMDYLIREMAKQNIEYNEEEGELLTEYNKLIEVFFLKKTLHQSK